MGKEKKQLRNAERSGWPTPPDPPLPLAPSDDLKEPEAGSSSVVFEASEPLQASDNFDLSGVVESFDSLEGSDVSDVPNHSEVPDPSSVGADAVVAADVAGPRRCPAVGCEAPPEIVERSIPLSSEAPRAVGKAVPRVRWLVAAGPRATSGRRTGAELRGTGARVWRGMVPGSSKDAGSFWIGASGGHDIVLCESTIDAISCFAIYPDCICLSTSGVRANPRWLSGLLTHGYRLRCGFDAPGDAAAAAMITKHPQITRLRLREHDWNDV